MTLYKWKKAWRLQGEVVQASEKEPEGWKAADRWTVVLEWLSSMPSSSATHPASGLYSQQEERWKQPTRDATNKKQKLSITEEMELERLQIRGGISAEGVSEVV